MCSPLTAQREAPSLVVSPGLQETGRVQESLQQHGPRGLNVAGVEIARAGHAREPGDKLRLRVRAEGLEMARRRLASGADEQ